MDEIRSLKEISRAVSGVLGERFPRGGGGDLVTSPDLDHPIKEIDLVAEEAAIQSVGVIRPKWNIEAEDSGFIDKGGGETLVVDPIDGTFNAIHGIPLYSTSLALRLKDPPTITHSFIKNLATGDSYEAAKGGGAFHNGCEMTTDSGGGFKERGLQISLYLGRSGLGPLSRILPYLKRGRALGCISLEVCLVASGVLDAVLFYGRVPRVCDISAARLVLEEAGGEFVQVSGGEKIYLESRPLVEEEHMTTIAGANRLVNEYIIERVFPDIKQEEGS